MIWLTVAWVYVGILSPFLIACSYGMVRKFALIASPYVVIPSTIAICTFFFEYFGLVQKNAFYFHFLVAAFFIVGAYLFLIFKLGYSRPDALVISLLTVLAIDQLWQLPSQVNDWSLGLVQFEEGIVTAGWNYMAVPLSLLFLRTPKLDRPSAILLGITLAFAVFSGYQYRLTMAASTDQTPLYYLVFLWFAVFLLIFRASKAH